MSFQKTSFWMYPMLVPLFELADEELDELEDDAVPLEEDLLEELALEELLLDVALVRELVVCAALDPEVPTELLSPVLEDSSALDDELDPEADWKPPASPPLAGSPLPPHRAVASVNAKPPKSNGAAVLPKPARRWEMAKRVDVLTLVPMRSSGEQLFNPPIGGS